MRDIQDIPFDEALNRYYEMREAYLHDDTEKLGELRAIHPEMFEESTAKQLRETALLAKRFEREPRHNDITDH